MITIIDYEMGNLRSVEKAFESLGFEVRVSADPNDIKSADKVVLPGVELFATVSTICAWGASSSRCWPT